MNKIKKIKKNLTKNSKNKRRGSETIESLLIIAIGIALIVVVFYPEISTLVSYMIQNLNGFANDFILDLLGNT